jgi:hypothetical protein
MTCVIEAAGLGHQIVGPDRIAGTAAEPPFQALAGHLLQMRNEVLPIRPFLFFGVVVDRPAVVKTMRHVVPVSGDHCILYLGKVIEHLELLNN